MNNEVQSKQVIYNLTQLGSKNTVKPAQLIILYTKKIKSLESELEKLMQTLQTYSNSLINIANMLDYQTIILKSKGANKNQKGLLEELSAIQRRLIQLRQSKSVEVPIMVQKIVEVEIPFEVVKQQKVEKVMEVPVEREVVVQVEVEKIVEVERPVYIEKIIQVEVPVEVQKIVQVEKLVYITHEIEVEVQCPYCQSRQQ